MFSRDMVKLAHRIRGLLSVNAISAIEELVEAVEQHGQQSASEFTQELTSDSAPQDDTIAQAAQFRR